jgi:Flp pilus assembly protein TadD
MSLLLDALKPTEPEPAATADAGVEPHSPEPQEELLDGRATLALLLSKPGAQTTLSLVPTSSVETVPPASVPEFPGSTPEEPRFPEPSRAEPRHVGPSPVGPAPAGPGLAASAPAPVVEIARAAPNAERAPGAAAAPASGAAGAAAANKRATVAAPSAPPRAKAYALAGAALATLVGIAIVFKSLWWPTTNVVSYPRGGVQQTSPGVVEATTPSTAAVQVSSARPADQFAYTGNAPEIDLRTTDSPADATTPQRAIPQAAATPPTSATSVARRGAAARAPSAALSVTRSEGPSPIDRHVQAGYQALASGNVANAQTEYFAALELDPNNVDAWMGAATVAARGGNSKAAAAAYAKVLKLEPGNPDATAAMSTLGANGSSGENDESRLKILIASGDGGRPALHAALAGVYAADARWTEAAQEYFTALAKDPGNPDLAFDVAASLDQNRNPGMALTYYRQALAFAGQRPAQIDLHALEQRIAQLQARAGHPPGASEAP